MTLETAICQICGRERPSIVISVRQGVSFCNDNHADRQCHLKVEEKVKEQTRKNVEAMSALADNPKSVVELIERDGEGHTAIVNARRLMHQSINIAKAASDYLGTHYSE